MAIPLNYPSTSSHNSTDEGSPSNQRPGNLPPAAHQRSSSYGRTLETSDGGTDHFPTPSSLQPVPLRQDDHLGVGLLPEASLEKLILDRNTRVAGPFRVAVQTHPKTKADRINNRNLKAGPPKVAVQTLQMIEAERINDRNLKRVVHVVATSVRPKFRLVKVSETQILLHHTHQLKRRNTELQRRLLQFQRLFQDRKRLVSFINGPLNRMGLKVKEK